MKTLNATILPGLLACCFSLQAQTPPVVPAAGDPLFAPVATGTPPTLHEKFMNYAVITVGPRVFFVQALSASIRMANPPTAYPRAWKDGGGAFGRNYGNAFASTASRETARFAASALLHEDFRYRPSTSTNPLARSIHALAFTFVDKSDSGRNQLALSNFAGAAAGGFVGNSYLPAGYNNLSHAETRTAIAFGTFAGRNVLREFSPELFRFARKFHLPSSDIPVPEWWVKLDR